MKKEKNDEKELLDNEIHEQLTRHDVAICRGQQGEENFHMKKRSGLWTEVCWPVNNPQSKKSLFGKMRKKKEGEKKSEKKKKI